MLTVQFSAFHGLDSDRSPPVADHWYLTTAEHLSDGHRVRNIPMIPWYTHNIAVRLGIPRS